MPVFAVSSVRIHLACALVVLAAGCGSTPLDNTGGAGMSGGAGRGGSGASGGRSGGAFNRNVDILFLVDDSTSMRLSQQNLERNFPAFITALEGLPEGLPNLHLAVVSSDMGAADGSISGCTVAGKAGIFQSTMRGTCTATTLAPGATFISNVGGVANYTGSLKDVFSCVAVLGESGCGFEQQLRAVARALGADGQPAPAENQGFLRADAYLFIVMLTNEDDCSTPPGSMLYDAVGVTLTSTFGPPTSYRCNEFGHLCKGSKPPRLAPTGNVTDTVTLEDCVPAEANGMLTPVATLVAQIRSLKPDPDQQIVVAAITGPATPYQVHWRNPNSGADTGPWPELTHACIATDTSFADPAVRIGAFVEAFGENGVNMSICEDSYAPALQLIGERIGQTISPR